MNQRRPLLLASIVAAVLPVTLALLTVAPQIARAQEADAIWSGGPVVTMSSDTEATPLVAEAVAVRDGRIIAVGARADVESTAGPDTERIDLAGQALLPGFLDAHGHLFYQAFVLNSADLQPPPAGDVSDIPSLIEALKAHRDAHDLGPTDVITGFGYDDSLLTEQRHPTRDDLDAAFPDNPVVLTHVSGHLATTNSAALEHLGLNADSADPPGGHIRRRAGSKEPNGVLEETAVGAARDLAPAPRPEEFAALVAQAQELYAKNGITTAQDGRSNQLVIESMKAMGNAGLIYLDVAAYPGYESLEPLGIGFDQAHFSREYTNRFRIAGVKLMLDGSPQGKTAYLTKPFEVPPPGQPSDYRGYPIQEQAVVDEQVSNLIGAGIPILAHANGDAAADQLLTAVERALRKTPNGDHRTVMIHSQIVREDQIDRLAELGMIPSFFVAHTFYWGDWHRDSVLGEQRADRISPLVSAERRGIRYTIHNDAPVVPPDMIRLLWTATNRRTRSNDILGSSQRASVEDALRAVTLDAARQFFEEDDKGSIEVGKLADFVVLSANPLEQDPADLLDINVQSTWKEGQQIWPRP